MIRVTRKNPCPVCGKPDWCLIAEDGSAAICQRVEEGSVKRLGEAGWLHRLTNRTPRRRIPKRQPDTRPAKDFYTLSRRYQKRLTQPLLEALAGRLCVSRKSLQRLQIGFDRSHYSFPMRDGHDRIVGIRLRSHTGQFAVTGSRNGLFWPAGVKADSNNLLFIVEGESDTAALLDLDFDAIGRPSCSGGTGYIKTLLKDHDRQVIIVADKDPPKKRPDGSVWRPGEEGAQRLANEIKSITRSLRVIKPPVGKDARQWYIAGATAAVVMAIANNAKFI